MSKTKAEQNRDGIRAEMEYKEIYQLAKTRAGALVEVMGLEGVK